MSAPVILQKAVTPQMAQAYLRQGLDRVAGYVVRASEVSSISTPEDLIELHGLTFEGSPFAPDRPVHVLHLPQPPAASLYAATGGTSREAAAARGGAFVERPPFRGDGKAAVGDLEVDLMWLEHTRLSPGSRLWRFEPGTDEPVLVGTYHGVVFGWQDHEEGDVFRPLATRGLVGTIAATEQGVFPCDVRTKEDGTPNLVTIVSYAPDAGERGFTRTKAGTYARQLSFREVGSLAENHVTGRWHSLPVRVVDQGEGEDGKPYLRVFSLGRDADAAERLGMAKMDVGCYESVVPADALTDVVRSQRVPTAWANEDQLANHDEGPDAVRAAAARGAQGSSGQGERRLLNQVDGPMVGMPLPADEDGNPLDVDDPRGVLGPVLQRVAQGVVNGAPTGWQRIRVLCHMVGNGGDIMVAATTAEGKEAGLRSVPGDVAKALAELRHLTAKEEEGTWFTALVTIEPQGRITMRLDPATEPRTTKEPDAQRYREEAQYFPRSPEHTPDWLAAKFEEHGIDPAEEKEIGAELRARAETARDVAREEMRAQAAGAEDTAPQDAAPQDDERVQQ